MNIIAFTPNTWHSGWGSRQRIISGLAEKGFNCLFSSGPFAIWDRNCPEWKNAALFRRSIKERQVSVDLPGKFPFSWPTWKTYQSLVLCLYANSLKRELAKLGDKLLVICFHPKFYPLIRFLNPEYIIYFPYDDFSKVEGWGKELIGCENNLLNRANMVIGFSEAMVRRFKDFYHGPIKVLPLGVDFNFFGKAVKLSEPVDLASVPRPRIGYIGRINQKIDWGLVKALAEKRSQYNWVFIGGLSESKKEKFGGNQASYSAWEACLRLPNVFHLGRKEYSKVPQYMAHMDVNIMPYSMKLGWWTAGYPLKMHEYLSVGRPVISSDLEAVRQFSEVIEIPKDFHGWIEAIDRAVFRGGMGTEIRRIEIARENSWDSRIDLLESWISGLMGG